MSNNTDGIRVHDVVVISRRQKEGENGGKLGYSFCESDKHELVTGVGIDGTTIITKDAEGDTQEYDLVNGEKEYTYAVSLGSEVEYEGLIRKAIIAKEKEMVARQTELLELEAWLDTFTNSISFIGKLVRFAKQLGR